MSAGLSREAIASAPRNPYAKRAASEHFSVIYVPDSAAGGCAVVVSKKVVRTSVGRHLLKRRVKAAVKGWLSNGHILIMYAREGSASLSYAALADELTALLPRVGASRTM